MKRLLLMLTVLASSSLMSGCGQSGPLYVPGNPSQMAVPPSQPASSEETDESDETGESEAPEAN